MEENRMLAIGEHYPASQEAVELLLEKPADGSGDTRSGWKWFRLANGDLVLGFFPQGDGYFEVEGAFSDDYVDAVQSGALQAIVADVDNDFVELESDYRGRHKRGPERLLAYVETRQDGVCTGEVIRGYGDHAEPSLFEVEDNEPDDVWGPILSRIAESLGLNGSPEHCDGGEVDARAVDVGVGVFEIRHDGTPS